jgi:alkanesulfonate monooxygenase SsuD/methylene tetrahydromethanopterin reductase-like flavin-dependent oxidoreductase (luciferase family)
MYVGSPETVADRIAATVKALSLSRFDLLYAVGRVPHEQRMATIELYAPRGDPTRARTAFRSSRSG